MYMSNVDNSAGTNPIELSELGILYNHVLYEAYMVEMQSVQFLSDLSSRAKTQDLYDLIMEALDDRRDNIDRFVDIISFIEMDHSLPASKSYPDAPQSLVLPCPFLSVNVADLAISLAVKAFAQSQKLRFEAMRDIACKRHHRESCVENLGKMIQTVEKLESKVLALEANV